MNIDESIKRKYIDELGIKYEDTPQGWCSDDKERMAKWQKQREEWGFDERETWSLDYAFALWLYERLKVYNQINIIDTSFHKIKYKEEILSFQDCIDKMIEGLEVRIIGDNFYWSLDPEKAEKVNDAMQLFALCYHYLWW